MSSSSLTSTEQAVRKLQALRKEAEAERLSRGKFSTGLSQNQALLGSPLIVGSGVA